MESLLLYRDFHEFGMFMECNETCCEDEGTVVCFTDVNFSDVAEIETTPSWSLAVRWTYVALVVILADLGNLALIVILVKNRLMMKAHINHFIFTMCVADLILVNTGPITFTIRDTNQFWVLGELYCHLDGLIQVMMMQISVWCLTVISFDRMVGIKYPMRRRMKRKHSVILICFLWILSFVLALPFFVYRIYSKRYWADIVEVICQEKTDKTKIWWIINIIVLNWIPLVVMITCYVIMFHNFKKHTRVSESQDQPAILRSKQKVIKMVFFVLLAFIICWFPLQAFIIFRLILVVNNEGQVNEDRDKLYDVLFSVTQYIVYLFPVVNPFIYGFMNESFKKGFRLTFKCFFKDKPDFILVRGTGASAYNWKRTSTRSTLHSTDFKNRQIIQNKTFQARRSASFNCNQKNRNENLHTEVNSKQTQETKHAHNLRKSIGKSLFKCLGPLTKEGIEEERSSELSQEISVTDENFTLSRSNTI